MENAQIIHVPTIEQTVSATVTHLQASQAEKQTRVINLKKIRNTPIFNKDSYDTAFIISAPVLKNNNLCRLSLFESII